MLYSLVRSLLFRLDAECAHELVLRLLELAGRTPGMLPILRAVYAYNDPILHITCAGLHCANPVGLAAGMDKRAAVVRPMAAFGFGHIEVGTVTPRPQSGNPRPRMFRLAADGALINRLGFNSPGAVAAGQQLRRLRAQHAASSATLPVLGVNISKNRTTLLQRATEDYVAGFVALAPFADYLTINISSPNTPGLRQLHERAALLDLLGAVNEVNQRLARPRPLFVKVSPDETPAQLDQVIDVAGQVGAAGFVAANTTLERGGLHSTHRQEQGGLSGRPLAPRARAVVAHIFAATSGRLPIIGVGGVMNARDAYDLIGAGATLVQLYTGFVYGGPAVVAQIKRGLAQHLRVDHYTSVAQAVGWSQR